MKRDKIIARLETIIETGVWRNKAEFAEASGITPQILSNVLNPDSSRELPKSLIIGLARLNYNISWLLFGVGPMMNYSSPSQEVLDLRRQLDQVTVLRDLVQKYEKAKGAKASERRHSDKGSFFVSSDERDRRSM